MPRTPYMVDRDAKGLRIAMLELLEEDFQRARIARVQGEGMSPQSVQQQMERIVKQRTLTAGYYVFAQHIFRLDSERQAGLPLDIQTLASFEGAALVTLSTARAEHGARHPKCSACGTPQENRHHPKCTHCGQKFAGKGSNK